MPFERELSGYSGGKRLPWGFESRNSVQEGVVRTGRSSSDVARARGTWRDSPRSDRRMPFTGSREVAPEVPSGYGISGDAFTECKPDSFCINTEGRHVPVEVSWPPRGPSPPLRPRAGSAAPLGAENDSPDDRPTRRQVLGRLTTAGLVRGRERLADGIAGADARRRRSNPPRRPGSATLFEFKKVADGIYGAIAKPTAMLNCNAAVIVNRDHVLVVDTHSKPSAAKALIGRSATRSPGSP